MKKLLVAPVIAGGLIAALGFASAPAEAHRDSADEFITYAQGIYAATQGGTHVE